MDACSTAHSVVLFTGLPLDAQAEAKLLEEIDATRDLVGFCASYNPGWVCCEGGMTLLIRLQVQVA